MSYELKSGFRLGGELLYLRNTMQGESGARQLWVRLDFVLEADVRDG